MAKKGKRRPGVMLYFDDFAPIVKNFSRQEIGDVVTCILGYGQNGVWSRTGNARVDFAVEMLIPHIDRDGENYERAKANGRYMVYCRSLKERGETVNLSFEEFREAEARKQTDELF